MEVNSRNAGWKVMRGDIQLKILSTYFCHHLFNGNRLDMMSEISFESLVLPQQVACL